MTCDNNCPNCPLAIPVKKGETLEIEGVGVIYNAGEDGVYCLNENGIIETGEIPLPSNT